MKSCMKVLSLVLALVLAFSVTALAESATPNVDKIKEAGVLVVGTSADYPPYEFHTEIDGVDTIVGFDMSIAQYFADSLGVTLKIVDMPFDSLLISLRNGEFDLVMAGMTPNEERQKAADFTDILFKNDQLVIIRKADAETIKTADDLKGHKVGAQTGSIPYDLAVSIVGEADVVGLGKSQDLIMELKNGKIDAVFSNTMSGTPFVVANDDLLLQNIGLADDDGGFAGAVQQGREDLVAYFNTCIAEIKEANLLDQYVVDAQALANEE